MSDNELKLMSQRFRGFYPVVVDVETGGFNEKKDALLEIGAVTLKIDENGKMSTNTEYQCHINPFEGANMEPASMEINGIDPHHPFRVAAAKDEETAVRELFRFIHKEMKPQKCKRAIMIGHNTTMDHNFIFAAAERNKISRNPFHPFSTFDTVSLAGLAYGQTVLSRAAQAAGLSWDNEEAHTALYDAKQTAELFCIIVNRWAETSGPVWSNTNN
ncbi:MAG: ribonuclease T [Gammaproteobacteria bacterium]|nr:ribonuclease T [Gammaproteobacteria bacterium]